MGVALGAVRRFEESLNSFEHALEIDPENSDTWNNKGTALFNLQCFKEALEAFDKAIEIDPGNTLAWAGKGSAHRFHGEYEEAVKSLEKYIELSAGEYSPQVEEAWAMIFELKLLLKQQGSKQL